MKKTLTIATLATMAVLTMGTLTTGSSELDQAYTAQHYSNLYPDTGLVISTEWYGDHGLLQFQTQNGHIFELIEEDGDWYTGDLISVIFNDNGTPEVYDDIIVNYKYSGWIDEEDMYKWVK